MEAITRLYTISKGGRNLRVESKADIFSSFSYPHQHNCQLWKYNGVDFCQRYTGKDPLPLSPICSNYIKPEMNEIRVGLELIIIFTKKESWTLSAYGSICSTVTPSRNKSLSPGDIPVSGNCQTSYFPETRCCPCMQPSLYAVSIYMLYTHQSYFHFKA